VPWGFGAYELPRSSIEGLLKLARLGPLDVFVDLGSGTGSVVIEAARTTDVKLAIGVEIESKSRDKGRRMAIELLSKDQLARTDFWLGSIESEDFDYDNVTVAYSSFEEDENEVAFYRENFSARHLRVLKKGLPFVGYRPSAALREEPVWLFEMTFPLRRVRSKSEWAGLVLGRRKATIDDVYDYYDSVLHKRGIKKKEIALASNNLRHLTIPRF
jgi:hypothetical protein